MYTVYTNTQRDAKRDGAANTAPKPLVAQLRQHISSSTLGRQALALRAWSITSLNETMGVRTLCGETYINEPLDEPAKVQACG